MAKDQYLSPYQKGIVKRYYKNKDTLANQKLGELVSELYLEANPKKAERMWERVRAALLQTNAAPSRVEKLVAERNLKALAVLVAELF